MDHTYVNLHTIRKSVRPPVSRPKPCSHNRIDVKNGAGVVMYSYCTKCRVKLSAPAARIQMLVEGLKCTINMSLYATVPNG